MPSEREHFRASSPPRGAGDLQDVLKKNFQAVSSFDSMIYLTIVHLSFRTNLERSVSFDAHVYYFCYSKLL